MKNAFYLNVSKNGKEIQKIEYYDTFDQANERAQYLFHQGSDVQIHNQYALNCNTDLFEPK